jgi:hypothetical protein
MITRIVTIRTDSKLIIQEEIVTNQFGLIAEEKRGSYEVNLNELMAEMAKYRRQGYAEQRGVGVHVFTKMMESR